MHPAIDPRSASDAAPADAATTRERTRAPGRLARVVAVALLLFAYVGCAVLHARVVNVDVERHDQSTYLEQARILAASHFTAPTNRMQMPVYVYLQALFVDPTQDDAAAFARGKMVNVALSVLLLGVLAIVFRRTLPKREATVLWLATAFTVFVFRAGYFQTELLFYTLAFLGFVALCRLWERPSPWAAIAAGALEAAAYLTKGSVPPGMMLFAALFVAREVRDAWRARGSASSLRALAKNVGSLALVAPSFVLPMLPYLRTNKQTYGAWFYNLSSTYVIWFDSWEDFVAREKVLGNWHGWHLLPPEQRPIASAFDYLRTHGLGQIAKRELLGLGEVLGNVLMSHGYAEYVALYLAFLAIAFGVHRAPWRALARISPRSDAAFTIPFALAYVALFGFYAPIAAGNRFVLMLFMPVLWSMLRHGAQAAPAITVRGRTIAWDDLQRFVLVLLVLHVLFVLPMTITRIYAGG